MSRAGLNVVMGMGTVFAVLILISFIISGFSYINKWEENTKNKKNNLKNTQISVTPIVAAPVVVEELVDDLEIVAVISAALAATMNTSTDGFVVKSIKRRTTKTR